MVAGWLRLSLVVLFLPVLSWANAFEALYKDASQPVETRIADLVGRMTLEEKACTPYDDLINCRTHSTL